jgi:hypothetical protein
MQSVTKFLEKFGIDVVHRGIYFHRIFFNTFNEPNTSENLVLGYYTILYNKHAIYFTKWQDDLCILFYRVWYFISYRTENNFFYFFYLYNIERPHRKYSIWAHQLSLHFWAKSLSRGNIQNMPVKKIFPRANLTWPCGKYLFL